MIRLLIRIALKALAFMYVLPMIPGIQYHGTFMEAVAIAAVFSVLLRVVEWVVLFFATMWTLATFGLALLVLIPLWIVSFWAFPAVALFAVSAVWPAHLAINGLVPLLEGSFVLLIVSMVTGGITDILKTARKDRD